LVKNRQQLWLETICSKSSAPLGSPRR
jgi:hypothetical protein